MQLFKRNFSYTMLICTVKIQYKETQKNKLEIINFKAENKKKIINKMCAISKRNRNTTKLLHCAHTRTHTALNVTVYAYNFTDLWQIAYVIRIEKKLLQGTRVA